MKKLLGIALALIMVVSLVAACTSAQPTATPAPAQASSAAATAAPTAAPAPTEAKPAGVEVLRNPIVRQALSLAIDRDYICQTVFNNSRVPATGIIPAGMSDATAGSDFRKVGGDLISTDTKANIKKAQELLAQAGFPNGEGFPKLEYSINTSTSHQAIAEAVIYQWKQNLNIDVQLNTMEWNVFQSFRKTQDCQIARQGWIADYNDVSTFFDLFLSDGGNNDGHYTNADYDKLVKQADLLGSDPAKRYDLYHQAEKLIMDEMGLIPLVFYTQDVLAQDGFSGYGTTPTGNMMFWGASKDAPTICIASQPETLDPTMNQSVDGMVYTTHMFEGVYRLNTDGTYSLGQAKDVKKEAESDGSVKYTVTLRDDIFWSDGKPVTAQDFVYAYQRLIDPATASPYGPLFAGFFKNGEDVMGGKVTPDQLTAKVIDDKTFEFEFKSDYSFDKDLLAFANMMPLRQDIVSKDPTGWATKPGTLVSNGRYTMKTIANEDKLVMVKNDKYWDKDSTKVSQITWKLMSDNNAVLAAFKNKELDFVNDSGIPSDERAALMQTPEFHRFPYLGLYYVQLNNIAEAK